MVKFRVAYKQDILISCSRRAMCRGIMCYL